MKIIQSRGRASVRSAKTVVVPRRDVTGWWAPYVLQWQKQIKEIAIQDKDDWLAKRLFETDANVCEYANRVAVIDEMLDDKLYEDAIRNAWARSLLPPSRPLTCFQIWRMRAHARALLMLEGEIL